MSLFSPLSFAFPQFLIISTPSLRYALIHIFSLVFSYFSSVNFTTLIFHPVIICVGYRLIPVSFHFFGSILWAFDPNLVFHWAFGLSDGVSLNLSTDVNSWHPADMPKPVGVDPHGTPMVEWEVAGVEQSRKRLGLREVAYTLGLISFLYIELQDFFFFPDKLELQDLLSTIYANF